MKKISSTIALFIIVHAAGAQISGTPAPLPTPQAVPKAVTSDKAAAPKTDALIVPANPVPPVYPGAEQTAPIVMPRELVYPAAAPAPTQPVQTEPLTPIEATNPLQPTRPQPDRASRENMVNGRPASVIPDNRTNKNDLRAATTVEAAPQTRTNNVVFPAKTTGTPVKRKSAAPVKTKTPKAKTNG